MKTVEEVPDVQSPMNRLQLATICLASLLNGFNDGSLGAVLPYMERDYRVGYAVVSLIFIGQGIGCLFAAIFLDDLHPRLGQVDVFRIAKISIILGYLPMVVGVQFPLIPIAFSFVGFGATINKILGKTLCSQFPNQPFLSEILYGCYSIGAVASPLVATAMVATEEMPWNRFYIINIGLAILVLALSSESFRCHKKEPNAHSRGPEISVPSITIGDISHSLCTRTVLLGAIFIFAYRGVEASISGWIIAFLIDTRMGNPQSFGYVLASFWAGIAVGRFGSSDVEDRFSQNSLVYVSVILASGFQLLVWLIPNAKGITIMAFAVGALLGPIYSRVSAIFVSHIEEKESFKAFITITAIEGLGGAIASFITGLLAQVVGTTAFHPVVLVLLAVLLACWLGIPSTDKHCGLNSTEASS